MLPDIVFCCHALQPATCAEAQGQLSGSCTQGTYDAAKGSTTIPAGSSFTAVCCSAGSTPVPTPIPCLFTPSGNCPAFNSTVLSNSLAVTAGSNSNSVNVAFNNTFIYTRGCNQDVSYITVASCTKCQKIPKPAKIGTTAQLTDVACSADGMTTIYIIAHDGSYNQLDNSVPVQSVALNTCGSDTTVSTSGLSGDCFSDDKRNRAACSYQVTVPCVAGSSNGPTSILPTEKTLSGGKKNKKKGTGGKKGTQKRNSSTAGRRLSLL